MNVLHVYRTFFPDTQGGLEEVIRQICMNATPHGVESRVFTLSPEPEPARVQVDGIEVVRVKQSFEIASCGFCFAGLAEFRRQVAWADVVHYHFPWPWGDVMYMLAGRGKATVVTYHSDIVRQQLLQHFYHPLMRRFLGSASRIVATSPNYFASSDVLKRFTDKVEVIPIGIEESSYPAPAVTAQAMERTRQTHGEDFFLFVGVLRYYKGLNFLLEAMSEIPETHLVVAGAGPEREALMAQATDLELGDRTHFLGRVDQETAVALLNSASVFCLPAHERSEAFGQLTSKI